MCPRCDRKRKKAAGRNYCSLCEAAAIKASYNKPEKQALRAATRELAVINWARKQWAEVGCGL
jgi:hypothetical protein